MATPRKPGAKRGRPPGAKSKHTLERAEAVQRASSTIEGRLEEAGVEPFHGDAHALLIAVYKDTREPITIRVDAAKSAIRYEKPALASIDHTGANVKSHEAMLDELELEPIQEMPDRDSDEE